MVEVGSIPGAADRHGHDPMHESGFFFSRRASSGVATDHKPPRNKDLPELRHGHRLRA
jgi:hypothetical protein